MRRTTAACTLSLLAISLAAPTASANPATAEPSAKLTVALTPERLGAGTTIIFNFKLATPPDSVPPPLTGLDLLYPANIGLITSGLGLATCEPAALEELGPIGCPPDSLMGYGSALAEIPLGPEIARETGHVTTWMAPVENGHLRLLFDAESGTPVSAQFVFTALLLEAPAPYGGKLETHIPIIPSVPEAPDVAVVQMRATIGPKNVTYYQYYHGKRIPYHPIGLRLPETCPHGGFPFAATFAFLDNTHATARTTVPCPKHRKT